MSADLKTLQAAIVADLATAMGGAQVNAHGGRFDVRELDTFAVRAPELRVALLRAKQPAQRRRGYQEVSIAAYIIARPDRHMRAPERGLTLASLLLLHLQGHAPGQSVGASLPDGIDYTNLYSSDTRDRGVHLGAATWTQLFAIEDDRTSALDELRLVACSYDLVASLDATPDATDMITLGDET